MENKNNMPDVSGSMIDENEQAKKEAKEKEKQAKAAQKAAEKVAKEQKKKINQAVKQTTQAQKKQERKQQRAERKTTRATENAKKKFIKTTNKEIKKHGYAMVDGEIITKKLKYKKPPKPVKQKQNRKHKTSKRILWFVRLMKRIKEKLSQIFQNIFTRKDKVTINQIESQQPKQKNSEPIDNREESDREESDREEKTNDPQTLNKEEQGNEQPTMDIIDLYESANFGTNIPEEKATELLKALHYNNRDVSAEDIEKLFSYISDSDILYDEQNQEFNVRYTNEKGKTCEFIINTDGDVSVPTKIEVDGKTVKNGLKPQSVEGNERVDQLRATIGENRKLLTTIRDVRDVPQNSLDTVRDFIASDSTADEHLNEFDDLEKSIEDPSIFKALNKIAISVQNYSDMNGTQFLTDIVKTALEVAQRAETTQVAEQYINLLRTNIMNTRNVDDALALTNMYLVDNGKDKPLSMVQNPEVIIAMDQYQKALYNRTQYSHIEIAEYVKLLNKCQDLKSAEAAMRTINLMIDRGIPIEEIAKTQINEKFDINQIKDALSQNFEGKSPEEIINNFYDVVYENKDRPIDSVAIYAPILHTEDIIQIATDMSKENKAAFLELIQCVNAEYNDMPKEYREALLELVHTEEPSTKDINDYIDGIKNDGPTEPSTDQPNRNQDEVLLD